MSRNSPLPIACSKGSIAWLLLFVVSCPFDIVTWYEIISGAVGRIAATDAHVSHSGFEDCRDGADISMWASLNARGSLRWPESHDTCHEFGFLGIFNFLLQLHGRFRRRAVRPMSFQLVVRRPHAFHRQMNSFEHFRHIRPS